MNLEQIRQNPELYAQLQQAKAAAEKSGASAEDFAKTACAMLNAAGIETTEQNVLDAIVMQNAELSDEDLDKIAGGGCSGCSDIAHCECPENC